MIESFFTPILPLIATLFNAPFGWMDPIDCMCVFQSAGKKISWRAKRESIKITSEKAQNISEQMFSYKFSVCTAAVCRAAGGPFEGPSIVLKIRPP